MRASLTIVGNDILGTQDNGHARAELRIPFTSETLARLRAWADQYDRAVRAGDPSVLLSLGSAMWTWLDASRWASAWATGTGHRTLEIAVEDPDSAAARALLDVPWETLARGGDFLAADPHQAFVVYRSIGRPLDAEPLKATYRDLAAIFMAAAPTGQRELAYEAEEVAILDATARLPLYLCVEESGCSAFLQERLAQEGPFEVVHLTCHGDIDQDLGPVLALETPEGDLALTTAGALAATLGEQKAPLVFLSACRTAESVAERGATTKPEAAEPFARALVRAGVPNVLGWDGPVYDVDATRFARTFYRELGAFASVPYAAAAARHDLLRAHQTDPHHGQHWHLARVYAGAQGGGALCDRAKPRRRFRRAAGYREFLDKATARVPVATTQEFVGRRRQAQAVLQALRDPTKAGVLLYGMGQIGKSSLAARIANRLPTHETVVIYDRYDALAIFDQLLAALPPSARHDWEEQWRARIAGHATVLGDALEAMLEGPFDASPLLLIVDDLEQILAPPQPEQTRTPVHDAPGRADAWRTALAGVLRAFGAVETASHLLLTSRYRFTLPNGQGRDLADTLEPIQLRAMASTERKKQWQAAARAAARTEAASHDDEPALVARVLDVAGGNPGLQQVLTRPLLAGELPLAHAALDAVAHWKASGEVPADESAAQAFFQRLSFDIYRNALTPTQQSQLRAATLFTEGLPVPLPVLEAVGRAAGVGQPRVAIDRLRGLGLMEDWDAIRGVTHMALNPLARPLADNNLTDTEEGYLATVAITPLAAAWQDAEGDFPVDPRGVEAARLALKGEAPATVLERAAYAAGAFLFRREHDAQRALVLLEAARAQIDAARGEPSLQFLLLGSQCAERIGERDLQIALLEQGLVLHSEDKVGRAQIAVTYASATLGRDGPEAALARLKDAVGLFEEVGDEHSQAVAMGQIADILAHRGETDEALRIWREEELPVFERLGDVRSYAVTIGRIADILAHRGETDEALRIRREEQLPVFERLGDVRSYAMTLSKIADILVHRGETDEVLRIRREEELPVYERLGDVRSYAVTLGKIADILAHRGETDEALRIRREEQLPVFERLGDVRSYAVTLSKIADILAHRGETDKALRIWREEELPVYERLGDVHPYAVTLGKIADVLAHRGETDEALRIRREEELPVYERLGDVRSYAMTLGKIADILAHRGETDEALRIRREEELPVFERLGDVRSYAMTLGKIADILAHRGETDEALRIWREEELPVYERLGDVHSYAVTMGKIADILVHRGETDEVLRIRREEQLPVFERLGDVRSYAVTMGKIADILAQRGETDEALRIWREEQLPVFERLGDVRSYAVTMGRIADILAHRGETDEALRIRREEELPVYGRLGDVHSYAMTLGKIADILAQRGETEEALRIWREEELPVYERLGDVHSYAVTMGRIADILAQRGETEEALRIWREEELPVYGRLGDVHFYAMTLGKIADILAQRGETEEALRIYSEEWLPVAKATKDLNTIARIRFSCAQLRLSRGGLEQGEAQTIFNELAESFVIVQQLQLIDGIALVGEMFGQLLAWSGSPDEALTVLEQSARAFDQMQQSQPAAQVRELQQRIREESA